MSQSALHGIPFTKLAFRPWQTYRWPILNDYDASDSEHIASLWCHCSTTVLFIRCLLSWQVAYIRSYIYSYIHTFIHTYIHTLWCQQTLVHLWNCWYHFKEVPDHCHHSVRLNCKFKIYKFSCWPIPDFNGISLPVRGRPGRHPKKHPLQSPPKDFHITGKTPDCIWFVPTAAPQLPGFQDNTPDWRCLGDLFLGQ